MIYTAFALGAVLGLWVGLWSVPDAALNVPMDTSHGHTSAAYHPVPMVLPLTSALLLFVSAWWTARAVVEVLHADGGAGDD